MTNKLTGLYIFTTYVTPLSTFLGDWLHLPFQRICNIATKPIGEINIHINGCFLFHGTGSLRKIDRNGPNWSYYAPDVTLPAELAKLISDFRIFVTLAESQVESYYRKLYSFKTLLFEFEYVVKLKRYNGIYKYILENCNKDNMETDADLRYVIKDTFAKARWTCTFGCKLYQLVVGTSDTFILIVLHTIL